MAQLRQPRPPPLPTGRVAELELILKFEPTYTFERFVSDAERDVTDSSPWQNALEEWQRLTGTSRGAAFQRFPDEWPTLPDALAARARRDAALEAGGSEVEAVAAMHPARSCSCRRHRERWPETRWPTLPDALAARARRDAVLEAGGSRAEAVNAMHPVRCTCRRHRTTTR